MSSENFYNILGVNEQATQDELKKAYRSMQMKFHPDKNPTKQQEAHAMTQKINEAYETLSDPAKRTEYDMMQNNPFFKMAGGGPEEFLNMMFFGGGMPFMGMGGGANGMPPGAKIHIFHGSPFQQAMNKPVPIMKSLQITMEQVLNGASLPLEIERWIVENGTKMFEKETIYVDVPPGIDENEMIILRDKGNVVNEHCKGDIKISILVQNNTPFKRMGLDLILEKTITLKESLCGFSFDIVFLNGKNYTLVNAKGNIIPPNFKKLYPGMGLKRGDHKGNMIIAFNVEFPEKLSLEQIDTLMTVL